MRVAGWVCSLAIGIGSVMMAAPAARANVAVGVAIRIGPPALPVYTQPLCPGPGYIWTPGYWAWGDAGYYWVPGTWVLPPEPGLLWTPGYWAFSDGAYAWNAGYWGPTVGFYGGIDYGFGYPGVGFFGGYWRGRTFYYNRAVTHVDVHVVRYVYDHRVEHAHSRFDRVSFNGGVHGVRARPTAREEAAMREHHVRMTAEQSRHVEFARSHRELRANVNHGRPNIAATQRPAEFRGGSAERRGSDHSRPAANPGGQGERVHQPMAMRNQRQMQQSRQRQATQRQQRAAQQRQARAQRQQQSRQQAQFRRAQQRQARERQRPQRQAPREQHHKPPRD